MEVKLMDAMELHDHVVAELQKLRDTITADQALDMVRKSLDTKIAAAKSGGAPHLSLPVDVPMMW